MIFLRLGYMRLRLNFQVVWDTNGHDVRLAGHDLNFVGLELLLERPLLSEDLLLLGSQVLTCIHLLDQLCVGK